MPEPQPVPPPPATPQPGMPAPTTTTPPAVPQAQQEPTWPTQIGGKDLEAWIKELRESPDGNVREMAVKVIPMFGPAARSPALRPLCQQLARESDPGVRINIIILLGAINAEKPEEIKMVVEALNGILGKASPGSPVRLHAARALASYGPAAAQAIPILLTMDSDFAWETRQAVAYTVGRIGRATDPKKGPNLSALNSLSNRLNREESAAVRLEIAQSMLVLGPPAHRPEVPGEYERNVKQYLDAVTKRLETETDAATKVWLLMVQMTYDGRAYNDTTIAKIADFIHMPDIGGRIAALRALALLGDKAKPALPNMLAALKWDDPALLTEAMVAAAALRGEATAALPDLERIKNGTDEYLKLLATNAITEITKKP